MAENAPTEKNRKSNGNGANLGFEADLSWQPTSCAATWSRPTTSTSLSA